MVRAGSKGVCARVRPALKLPGSRVSIVCVVLVLYVIVCVLEAVLLVALDECVPQHACLSMVQGKRCSNFFTLLRASDYIHRLVAAVRTAGVTLFTLAKFVIVCSVGSVYRTFGVGRNATPAHPARVVMQIPRIRRGL